MTREQIEKAWKEHTLYNPSFEDDISLNEKQAFVKGAQWRINSVWYDSFSAYIPKKRAIVVLKNGVSNIYKDLSVITRKGMWNDVEMFAYIDDLIPERKEETE